MRQPKSHDVSVHGIDVGQVRRDSTGMSDRKLGVDLGIKLLLGEEPPVGKDPVVVATGQLDAPGSIIETFVPAKEER